MSSKTAKRTIARIAKATEWVDSDRRTSANAKQRLRDRITIRGNPELKDEWEAFLKAQEVTAAEGLERLLVWWGSGD